MSLDEATRERIESLIRDCDVTLFMKGDREGPQCGFSATVVRILDSLLPEYRTVDVLSDPAVREGIKVFSSWPTIPQLYVKGEFVGGCDIVQELYASGELHESLGVEAPPKEAKAPQIEISPESAASLQQALEQQGGPDRALHLAVDARFRSSLYLAPVAPGEVACEAGGVTLHLDPLSARRAEGVRISVVQTPRGPQLRVDSPLGPAVGALSVRELAQLRESGRPFELVDVRTPEERATASIPGSVLLTEEESRRLESLPKDTLLVFHCHHGGRSQVAAERFSALGFSSVYNVAGGIEAWSLEIDPEVPRY
jgi:monothiol glutaredoxin